MTAQKIIEKAASQIGVKENPANSNNVKYNTVYYGRAVSGSAYPWCCAFIWWLFYDCGASELFYGGKKTAYCPTVESYYRSIGRWYSSGKAGDLVLFDFDRAGIAGHIGIVEAVNADGSYTTIEGNTSVSSNDNGGSVMRRTRYKSTIRGFARPDYAASDFKFTEMPVNYTGTITASILNIRKQPTTSSEIIGKHTNGDTVWISAKTDNGWYRVDYPNIGTGYISDEYVSVVDNTPPVAPAAPEPEPKPVEPEPEIEILVDNTPDEWAADAVNSALNNHILFGDENGDYKLHKECTREEIIVFLYRMYRKICG